MFSVALVADAKAYFERHLDRPVSDDEARNFLGNFTDFFTAFDGRRQDRQQNCPCEVNQNNPK